MYILRITKGKEKLITKLMRMNGLSAEILNEKGFIVTREKLPVELFIKIEKYLIEVIEISEEDYQKFTSEAGKEYVKELEPGSFIEINSGVFQNYKGVLRNYDGERAIVDINILGNVSTVEVHKNRLRPVSVPDWV